MKSVRIIALRQDRKRLLEHLQDSGLVQIEKTETCRKGFGKIDMTSQIQIFERNVTLSENALKILDSNSPEKKSMLSAFCGRREIDPDEIGVIASNAGEVIDVCNRICELNKQIADNAAERIRIKTALAQLEPWKNLDIPLNAKDTKTTAVFIGSIQKEYNEVSLSKALAEASPKLEFDFEIQFTNEVLTCIVLFAPIAQKELAENALRDIGFAKPVANSSLTPLAESKKRNVTLSENALKILDSNSPEKKSMLSAFCGRREIDPDEIGVIASNAGEVIDVCNRICELNKQIADNAAERIRIKTALAQLEPWKNLDIPLNAKDTKTTAVFIGSIQKEYNEVSLSKALAEASPKLEFDFEIQFTNEVLTCIVLFAPIAQKELAENALRDIGFAKPVANSSLTPLAESKKLVERSHKLEDDTENAKKEIISFADRRKDIKDTQDYFRIRADKYSVIGELQHSRNVFVISGYIPEEDCEKLERLCERVSVCYVEFGDVDEEKAPVKLKNSRFAAPAESIVNMYSPPSHDDIDPTPLLAFFFYFFFGMMFSDAGYGLLMVIGTGLAIKLFKPDREMRNTLKLFQYCGVSTFFWGLVFASFFGDAPATLYNYFTGASITMKEIFPWPTIDPQKDALMLMIISIAFGLVHILVGMGCKFYVCLRQKDYGGAFFDTGLWMLMLIGFAVLAAGMAFGQTLIYIGAGIAIFCAIGLVLTQGRNKKGFGKVIGGLASLYDITGYISDLLSYSRLLALGLTTGVMAQVFNMLSTMFGKSWFGIILLIIVFIIGHAINIGLNALGSYVHTMRLQYVEMFGKFYEGGGKQFKPFKLNSKYIKIQEDKSK